MNKNICIYKMKMKFDLRYAFLAILIAIVVYKMTVKEKYMCGGKKREGYATGGGVPFAETESVQKTGQCPKCGSTDQTYGEPCKCSKGGGTEGYCSSCGVK
jgi:hypothetical protein|tara:strand:- start:1910 stop:2212 length:303 start_codon:yes stop_codon:yes gene_type:complete